jgi:RNA polymerase sigma-70 factor (ECF subfamily)
MIKNSFEEIVREHKDRLFSYAFYVLGNREDAEDVTQEVFIKLWENLREIDAKRYRPWIMKVAHNRCVDLARERKKSIYDHQELNEMITPKHLKQKNLQTNPEPGHDYREMHAILLRALSKLPVQTRSMLVLHYYQGMKYRAIAEIFDTTPNATKVEVHRGRRKLKKILADQSTGEIGSVRDE